jgi:hypothetical protein
LSWYKEKYGMTAKSIAMNIMFQEVISQEIPFSFMTYWCAGIPTCQIWLSPEVDLGDYASTARVISSPSGQTARDNSVVSQADATIPSQVIVRHDNSPAATRGMPRADLPMEDIEKLRQQGLSTRQIVIRLHLPRASTYRALVRKVKA